MVGMRLAGAFPFADTLRQRRARCMTACSSPIETTNRVASRLPSASPVDCETGVPARQQTKDDMQARLNPYQLAPELMKPMMALEEAVKDSGLESSLIHLVKTRAS